MNISGKNLTLVFGLAAGTAIALLANRTSRSLKKISSKKGAGYLNRSVPARQLYDDSEVYYV